MAEAGRIPAGVQAARVAEMLYLPVLLYMMLSLPLAPMRSNADMFTLLVLVAEAAFAVAAFIGLRKRSTLGWGLAIVLALWVIVNAGLQGPSRVSWASAHGAGRAVMIAIVGVLLWSVATQVVVLAACLSRAGRDWIHGPR